MTARPGSWLDWALTLVTDAISGQDNRIEPPAAWSTGEGWKLGEKPPRNYLNWWQYMASLWTRYLDEHRANNLVVFVCASNAGATHQAFADSAYLCDGDADEIEINAAITAVNAAGGGIVLLSPGTFTVDDSVTLLQNVELVGSGKNATVITVANGVATGFSIVYGLSAGDCAVKNLGVDGNAGGITGAVAHVGIDLDTCLRARIEDVYVQDMKTTGATNGIGIRMEGVGQSLRRAFVYSCELHGVLIDTGGTNSTVDDVLINGAGADGVHVDGAGCTLQNVRVTLSTLIGIDIDGANCKAIECRSYSNATVGIYATGAGCELIGCTSNLNDTHGIVFDDVLEGKIVNCRVEDNSQATTDTSDGIFLTGASGGNILVTANTVRGADHKYAFHIADAPNAMPDCQIFGNDFRGFTTAAISDVAGAGETIPMYLPDALGAIQTHDLDLANQIA
jgi:hypothetical protein